MINEFNGENRYLSNFYNTPVEYKGITYLNSESAYQAQKCEHEEDTEIFIGIEGSVAKKLGKHVEMRKDWDKVKVKIMYEVVKAKFTQNEDLKSMLINTGNQLLIEGNYWKDKFWGVYKGEGKNNLGKILMKVRSELVESK